jgi:hypothetical protein
MKPMRLAVLVMGLFLADRFYFEGQYGRAVWLELRSAGDGFTAKMASWTGEVFGRK